MSALNVPLNYLVLSQRNLAVEYFSFMLIKSIGFFVFQSSERAVSVPASPLLVPAEVSLTTEAPLHGRCPEPVQEAIPEENCKSTEGVEKPRTTSTIPPSASNEEREVGQTEMPPSTVTVLTSASQFPLQPSEPTISIIRRESFSNASCFDFYQVYLTVLISYCGF